MGSLDSLFSSLYGLVRDEAQTRRKVGWSAAGHVFEDITARKIFLQARRLGLSPNPPRHTLQYPTFSGGFYQFDASFVFQDTVFVVECKRTKIPAKIHLHYFFSQILDYLLGAKERKESFSMRGIFLSTVDVNRSAMIYALTYGITVIDPVSPPVEYILSTIDKDSRLYKMAMKLSKDICSSIDLSFSRTGRKKAGELYREYRFLCKRWKDEIEAYSCSES